MELGGIHSGFHGRQQNEGVEGRGAGRASNGGELLLQPALRGQGRE